MSVPRILWAHALRPSSFTLLTVVGLNVGQLLGGAVVVEFLFDINGMGSQLAAAVLRAPTTSSCRPASRSSPPVSSC